jgi:TatD DNase family protein
VLERAHAAGVRGAVICAADPADWDRLVRTAELLGQPWTLGVHPWWEAHLDEPAWTRWHRELNERPSPHGLGETGLDRPRARSAAARDRQLRSLQLHLQLARARGVPVVLHCVGAYGSLLDALAGHGLPGVIVHSWSGPPELVERAVKLGLHLSFSASALRSPGIAAALRLVPADRLLIETDCPDQPLHPGARGEPADLPRLAAALGALRSEPAALLLDRSRDALRSLFPALRG